MVKRFLGRFFATIGALVVLVFTSFFLYKILFQKNTLTLHDGTVLVMDLSNTVPETPADFTIANLVEGPRPHFYELLRAIIAAAHDPRVAAIALNIESPEMGLSQLYEIREALKSFRQSGKKVYAFCTTFGDLSPGLTEYYIASVADKIWLQPFSSLNLTGLHVDQPYLGALLRKFDIKPQIYARTVYKNAYSFLTNDGPTPEELDANKHLLTQLYQHLSTDIEAAREFRAQMIHDVTQQHPLMSDEKALELGFIDGITYKDQCLNLILKETAVSTKPSTIKSPKQNPSLFKHPRLVSLSTYAILLEPQTIKTPTKIALIYGAGTIMQERATRDLLGQSVIFSAKDMEKQFDQALADPNVRAIVFRIDSPGGSAVASESIRRMVLIAHEKNIPVVASFGNYAASGGYWVAAPCDKIFATPLTITGSIGALGGKISFRDLLEQNDINVGSYSTGNNGSLWSPLSPYTDEQDRHINQVMDRLYARFIQVVADGRKLSLDHVSEVAKGRVWSGTDALKFGLIDELGGLREAIAHTAQMIGIKRPQDFQIVEYPKPLPFLERLQEMLTGDITDLQELMSSLRALYQTVKLSLSQKASLTTDIRIR